MQKMGKSNQKETKSMNRNLVGVRSLRTKSPHLTDKKFLLIPLFFPSLICSFDLRRRYSRSEKLKKIWLYPRLFVSLQHNCK